MFPVTTANPAQPWWRSFSREHWFVFIIASLAWLFDSLDQQFFNLARDAAMEDLLADKTRAMVYAPYTTSVFLVGWAIGGLIFGALGDRYGRARILTISVLLYSGFTGLNALSTSFLGFCVYRFLAGLGIGGVFGLAVALVADSIPDHTRPPALGLLQSLSTCGNILAGLIGMSIGALAARHLLPFGLKAWQVIFLVGAAPAFLCVFIFLRLKEPEKWVRARADGAGRGIKFGSYAALLGHPRWSRHAWAGLLLCLAGIVGLWGVGNFHPKIVGAIIQQHLAAAKLSPDAMASELAFWRSAGLLLQNIGGFAGMMTLAWIAQVRGRRPALVLALLCSFLSTVLVFRWLREFSQIFWMLPLMGFGQLSIFAIYAIYLPELFPTSLRSTGTSFCYNCGRILAASAPFTVGKITQSLGGDLEAFRTAGLWVSLVLLLGPRRPALSAGNQGPAAARGMRWRNQSAFAPGGGWRFQRPQIRDEIAALGGVADARERHQGSGHDFLRIGEVRIEGLFIPDNIGRLHRPAVTETRGGPRLPAHEASEPRPRAVAPRHGVADRTLDEELFSSGGFLRARLTGHAGNKQGEDESCHQGDCDATHVETAGRSRLKESFPSRGSAPGRPPAATPAQPAARSGCTRNCAGIPRPRPRTGWSRPSAADGAIPRWSADPRP